MTAQLERPTGIEPTTMAAARCVGASRRYVVRGAPPVVAVDGATFYVNQGEFVAIQGPSGSGKTTLLGLLAGLEPTDSGSVEVLGHDLSRLTPAELARLRRTRIGIVLQSFALVAALTAAENVALPLALDGAGEAERREIALAALADVGLRHAGDARIDELSGGERQRVAIARALAHRPALVLADEPTGSLDEENAGRILDVLRHETGARGASLVLVTHDPASAARADRRYSMRDGRLTEGAVA
jgi:putative ABC transport system ATP-binding protein